MGDDEALLPRARSEGPVASGLVDFALTLGALHSLWVDDVEVVLQ